MMTQPMTKLIQLSLALLLTLPLIGCPGAQTKPTTKTQKATRAKKPVDLNNPTPAQLSKIPCANPMWVKPPEGMQDDTKTDTKTEPAKNTKAQVIIPAQSGASPCDGA